MAAMLIAKDVSLAFPSKRLFEAVTLSIDSGDRLGIVGLNGDGKSSLLSLLAGELACDSGEITRRSDVTVGILHQNDALPANSTALAAATGSAPTHQWAADRKSREIIETLLAGIDHQALIGQLSGGERRRVDLARVLIANWDVLMLDEPTNHLDIQTISWLARHLQQRWSEGDGALLVVTHDRWFIDEVCARMWEVHAGQVKAFDGGYSAYILQRVERDRLYQQSEEKRQNQMRKELAWLSRGARARSSKPRFHMRQAQELIADVPPLRNTLELKRAATARLGKQVLELVGVTEVLGGRTILDDIDFIIGPGDRLAILGSNGAGKTTLLRLLTGELCPSFGTVKQGQTVRIAALSQQLEELQGLLERRVIEVLEQHKRGYEIDGKYVSATEMLSRLGFEQAYFKARVKDLSGGQKRRLQLLLTLLSQPNVMIMDEPGNDFDTDMLTVLEDLLDSWPGTLVLVSHDRYLVERVCDMQYALIGGKLRHLPGGVDEYLLLAQADASAPTVLEAKKRTPQDTSASPEPGNNETAYDLRKQLASLERKINTLENQIAKQADSLQQLDPSDYLALGDAHAKLQELKDRLLELELGWYATSEALERLTPIS